MWDALLLTLDEWIFIGILLVMVYGIGMVPRWVDQYILGRTPAE